MRNRCKTAPGRDGRPIWDNVLRRAVSAALAGIACVAAATATASQRSQPPRKENRPLLKRIRVSNNKRFLVTQDGKPFFYLADTAWELFHRTDREQAVSTCRSVRINGSR